MRFLILAILAPVLLSGCITPGTKRRAFNTCTSTANAAFQAGRTTYAARTDKVKACLAEYNR